jgi:hypothetical protein
LETALPPEEEVLQLLDVLDVLRGVTSSLEQDLNGVRPGTDQGQAPNSRCRAHHNDPLTVTMVALQTSVLRQPRVQTLISLVPNPLQESGAVAPERGCVTRKYPVPSNYEAEVKRQKATPTLNERELTLATLYSIDSLARDIRSTAVVVS